MNRKSTTGNEANTHHPLGSALTTLMAAVLVLGLTQAGAYGAALEEDSFSLKVNRPVRSLGSSILNRKTTFLVQVSQCGHRPARNVAMRAELEGDDSSSWDVSLSNDRAAFLPGPRLKSDYLLLNVEAGEGVDEGDVLKVKVIGESDDEVHEVVVEVLADSFHPVLEPTLFKDWRREKAEKLFIAEAPHWNLTLANLGQERDRIQVSVDAPQGWTARVSGVSGVEGESSAIFSLAGEARLSGRNTIDVDVTLIPPTDWPKNVATPITVTAQSLGAAGEPPASVNLTATKGGFLVTASDLDGGSPRAHNLNPGKATTYILQLTNVFSETKSVDLSVDSVLPAGWTYSIEPSETIAIQPGEQVEARLEVESPRDAPIGSGPTLTVTAEAATGEEDSVVVACRTTEKRKVYFVAIDALNQEYLELNRAGTGKGSDGDWLMPNIHAFMEQGSSYSEAYVHLPAATDMNHLTNISGSMPGTEGLHSVAGYYFGLDENGHMVVHDPSHDVIRWGEEGEPVLTLFDVAKDPAYGGEPTAFNAVIAGKNWVAELMRDPDGVLDRVAHGQDVPFYLEQPRPYIQGDPPSDEDAAADPNYRYPMGRLLGDRPGMFPDDHWVMDGALRIIENEDPDVFYILMAEMDDGQHVMGAAWDLDEWLDQGTESTWDDISRINPLAVREGVLDIAREADHNFGRFIDYLRERGTLDNVQIVVTADHGQVTHLPVGVDYKQILRRAGISPADGDRYATIGASSVAFIYDSDPETADRIETILQETKRLNQDTGRRENPFVVINREEMRTGVDTYTGEAVATPDELYSIWYAEFPVEDNSKQRWPDLFVFTRENWQIPLYGGALFNLGLDISFAIPELSLMVGGHGGPETLHIPLIFGGPGFKAGYSNSTDKVHNSSIAPTLYALNGWTCPAHVDGPPLTSCMEGSGEVSEQ